MSNHGNGDPNRPSKLKRKNQRAIDQHLERMQTAQTAQADQESNWLEQYEIGTCQGCGAYGKLGKIHNRRVFITGTYMYEECGEYL